MKLYEWLTILAILIGPIAAVQAQQWVERVREDRGRRLQIFKTLMATRATVLSPEHVHALNMIDLEFHGEAYKKVTLAWKTYLDHLGSYPKGDEGAQPIWRDRSVTLLTALLLEMGKSLAYPFDEVHIRKGIYIPEAHGQLEQEQLLVRRGLIRVLFGDNRLKMDVMSFPTNPEAAQTQRAFIEAMGRLAERIEHVENNAGEKRQA